MMLAAGQPLSILWVLLAYLGLLIVFSLTTGRLRRGSSQDYFLASRSIGPFLLLMSVFGTTMTAFAMVGSTAKAYDAGIGVYGLMASMSGIIHPVVFFLVGIRLWAIGKKHDYTTQIQYFRARFDSPFLGTLLFPILVALVVPYLLIGILGSGTVIRGVTAGMFPETFPGVLNAATNKMLHVGAVPPWLSELVICLVVLFYILRGGVRAAAVANAAQTIVFMSVGVVAFWLIAQKLGGVSAAARSVAENAPRLLTRGHISHGQFLTYAFVPLSVGMFPHLFQHWLTARNAKTFRTTVVAHPVFIMIVWMPCILIGIWAAGIGITAPGGNSNAILGRMVASQLDSPVVTGLLTAGILAAIMSSLDSQFVCLGTMFTHDVILHRLGRDRVSEATQVLLGRAFTIAIVAITYLLARFPHPNIFDLAVWCFSGFASLFPLVFGAIYWRRATATGAIASVIAALVTFSILFYDGLIRPAIQGQPASEDYLVLGVMPVTFMVLASTVALIVGSLLTKPPEASIVDRHFASPRHPGERVP